MNINADQANALLLLVSNMSVRQLRDCNAISAVAALDIITETSAPVGLYIRVAVDGSDKVKGIKTLREQNGIGLKEARDLYEELENQARFEFSGAAYIDLGPFKHVNKEDAMDWCARTQFDRAPIVWKK